jgi:hypothetical protein
MIAQPRPSCVAQLLDVRGFVLAARQATRQAEPAAALFMVAVFGLIALVLLPVYFTFDLSSTWTFTTGVRAAASPAVSSITSQAEGLLQLSIGAALTGVIFTGFTLLPSLFELAFPTVAHPLLSLILWLSITFDYVTDWEKTWNLVGTWTSNPVVRFIITAPLCAFFSVFVQALLVVSLTVVFFGLLSLLRGRSGGGPPALILQQ